MAALAIRQIRAQREAMGSEATGSQHLAFILDSVKHAAEVALLREVYDQSFRLVAVHCDTQMRLDRLRGVSAADAKFGGVPTTEVEAYVARDAKDSGNDTGQQVREVFHLADFFVDNSVYHARGAAIQAQLDRFSQLLRGVGLVRPTRQERAMYSAHAAALQSSCLSRQVGASLVSTDGTIVSTGANDVPKFGGGVYEEAGRPDHRCFAWEYVNGSLRFKGCHNNRKKDELRASVANWMSQTFSDEIAEIAIPSSPTSLKLEQKRREAVARDVREFFAKASDRFEAMPGVKDIIEYSRSIHAEMNTLLSAARQGTSSKGAQLFCTTFPCHNCARHLVTAGIHEVYYIEPYVKSLALELHSDAITTEPQEPNEARAKMLVAPFTGVGPRMFEDFFTKKDDLKKSTGEYEPVTEGTLRHAVRLRKLEDVEAVASKLLPERTNV